DPLDIGLGIAPGAGELARHHQVAVLAAQAGGLAAGLIYGGHDFLVDRTRQHHLDHLDGRPVSDPQAVGEFALDVEPGEHRADLRPAAMDHDRIDPTLLEQDDVAGEILCHGLVAHGVPAIFHHDGLTV